MKNLKNFAATIAMLLCCITVNAHDFEVDGIYYNITSAEDLTVEVTYKGTSYSNEDYTGDVVIPATVNCNELEYKVTAIGNHAFYFCDNLTSVIIPEGVASIDDDAFYGCGTIGTVVIPQSVVSVGRYAFGSSNNTTIKKINISSIEAWCKIDFANYSANPIQHPTNAGFESKLYLNDVLVTSVVIPNTITEIKPYSFAQIRCLENVVLHENIVSIGDEAFYDCRKLNSINIPEGVTSIGEKAFTNCSALGELTIPTSVKTIGTNAFGSSNSVYRSLVYVKMDAITPPTLTSSVLANENCVFVVPDEGYNAYIADPNWSAYAAMMVKESEAIRDVAITAYEGGSALFDKLGSVEAVAKVVDLTIEGSINSYDLIELRTQMTKLRKLDLSEASIVASNKAYYSTYKSEDDVLGAYSFYQCNLVSVELPRNIQTIGRYAFNSNKYLKVVEIPEGVVGIDYNAFAGCSALHTVKLPTTLQEIGSSAFSNSSLKNINFPTSLGSIGGNAFVKCPLEEIRIPSSVRTIGDKTFENCTSLTSVYVYTVEPIAITETTFTGVTAQLYRPKQSFKDYRYAEGWSSFTEQIDFDEPYEYFYVENDYSLDNTTGVITEKEGSNLTADMGNNSGLLTDGDINQELGDVNIEHDGAEGGSIIAGGNSTVSADNLNFRINVTGGRWYFFCFPFDIKAEDIKLENGAEWVFRYYDGTERAQNGKGGWKNVTSDGEGNHLKAATGYIFQCSADDVLVLTAKDKKIKKENKYNELVEHVTQNAHDASWNFVGNPYLSYYEVTADDYSAPITVWDGSQYIAIRPGDDDYQLAPFEAFFVQKPEGKDKVNYDADRQHTYHGAQKAAEQARALRRTQAVNPERLLVNLTLTDGQATDKTRVVFNNSVSAGYEAACDAAKFSTAGVPQLYTIDSRAVKYAINERPVAEGIVTVGFTAPVQGNYTIAAPRMDTPMLLRDNATGTIHDFSEGSYEFASEAGTYEDRFAVMMKSETTSIDNLESTVNGQQSTVIYDAAGRRVEQMEQGIYVKGDRKVVKM